MKRDLDEIKAIRQGLRQHRGAFTVLAGRVGLSQNMVRCVLRGDRNNDRVVVEAARLWRELENKRRSALKEAAVIAAEMQSLSTTI